MLLPFVGFFMAVTLWGSFFQVPGFVDPNEGFVKRISGALGVTAVAKGVYDLAEVITSAYTVPGHKDVYVPWTGFESPEDRVDHDTPETALSVVIPLWEEAVEQPVCDWNSTASTSPTPSSGFTIACLAGGILAFVLFLWKSLGSSGAYTLGTVRDWLGRCLGDTPKVAHYLVADGAPSLYEEMDALVAGPMSSEVTASFVDAVLTTPAMLTPPEEQQAESVATLHQEVEPATSRLERREEVDVVPGVDSCTVKKDSDSIPDGADDASANNDGLAPDPESATGSIHQPERQRDPEPRQPETVEAGAESETTPRNRRGNRPNQRQRRAYKRRLERERQEQLEREAEQANLAAGPGPLEQPAPDTPNLGPVDPGNEGVSSDAGDEQQGGPPPAPTPVMGVHPPPSGDIQPMPPMPPCPPHGPC